jgi:hypothetical protein
VGSFVATSGQKPWPSAGSFVAAYGQFFMAADNRRTFGPRTVLAGSPLTAHIGASAGST